MTSLLILGNTNRYTFANSIVAANIKSLAIFESALQNIFVFHSPESKRELQKFDDWEKHLERSGLSQDLFIDRVVDLSKNPEAVLTFINHFELVIQGLFEKSELIVDMTNGTFLQKNLFSVATYILNTKNQFSIDIAELSRILDRQIREIEFVDPEILDQVYYKIPDNIRFDNIAYLALSEIVRYKDIINGYEKKYLDIDEELADWRFFRDNLHHSVQLKLQGDKSRDNTLYRIASASIALNTEDLLSLLIKKFFPAKYSDKLMLGKKIEIIEAELAKELLPKSDYEFLRKFNDFILYLRNKTTHKDELLTDIERFKADLSVKMSFPFLEFYIEIIYNKLTEISEAEVSEADKFLTQNFRSDKVKTLTASKIGIDRPAYYGLDGDDTGRFLEQLFCGSQDEGEFIRLSNSVQEAIKEITKIIKRKDQKGRKQTIIFGAGDDILFKGFFNEEDLREMQEVYHRKTKMTCSIGYGWTLRSAYVALKIAKAQPGKNFIYGVEVD